MFNKKFFIENFKTLFYAFIIAIIIRSLIIQPFYIPSSSMEPGLLVGDRLFVTKYSYGYSKHSFPFSPPILSKRIIFKSPERGDVIVFKTPVDNRTDYIKRLIGLPGDKIQFIDANLYLNSSEIFKSKILIIAGSDSSGGAGIQADIKTITALGSYAMTAITAVTAQNTRGVKSIVPIKPKEISNQIIFTSNDIKPDAVKIGMLHSSEVIKSIIKSIS